MDYTFLQRQSTRVQALSATKRKEIVRTYSCSSVACRNASDYQITPQQREQHGGAVHFYFQGDAAAGRTFGYTHSTDQHPSSTASSLTLGCCCKFCQGSSSESSSFLYFCPLCYRSCQPWVLEVCVSRKVYEYFLSKSIFEKCSFDKNICFMKALQIQENVTFSRFRKGAVTFHLA